MVDSSFFIDLDTQLRLRAIRAGDPPVIEAAFTAQGWKKPARLYEFYLQEQAGGRRDVILTEIDGRFAGYLTVVWESSYPPFRAAGIPEIVDFNVLKCFQRRHVGSALMDEAERRIAARSPLAGIGVGLYPDYGPAQILYARRGYTPDGRGVYYRDHFPQPGQQVTLDDDLVLYFVKPLYPYQSAGAPAALGSSPL